MRTRALLAILVLLAVVPSARAVEPKTDEDKTLYAIGLVMSGNLSSFRLTESELGMIEAGLTDGVLGKEKKVDLQQYGPKIQELAKTRAAAAAVAEKEKSKGFLEKAAAEKGAKKTASGLIYQETTPGTGATPKATDTVKVHYTGKLIDGTVFDSSVQRGQPATFPLNGVIKCWTEGVQLMKVGGKSTIICPSDLAYGDRPQGPPRSSPASTLVFDVELLEIEKPAEPAKPEKK